MEPSNRDRARFAFAPALVVGGFGLAALSQLRVQAFGRQDIIDRGLESGRFVVERVDRARRGTIYSGDGKPLAQNEERSELGIIFDKVPHSPAFFAELGRASGIPASEFQQLLASGEEKAFWGERLSPTQTRAVQSVRSDWRADGISLARVGDREFPLREAASLFLGYFRDGKPLGGVEKALDGRLSGENGKTVGMVDRGGEFLPLRMDAETVPRRDGEDVRLTIDSEIQLIAASSVRKAVESNKADQGCAIVIEPSTGNILAMASWPSFDPERIGEPMKEGQRFSDFDPATMAVLEPGSTFKILTLALALDQGKVNLSERWNCTGSLQVWPTKSIHCDAHAGKRAHGLIDATDAIAKSCNVCAATWAGRIGYESFTEFLDKSGLMAKPGLGLPLEVRGSYNRNEYAKKLQLATFGFGQSLTVTPVGLCSAFSMLANGGIRMAPRLIAQVGSRTNPTKEVGRLVKEETAAEVMRAMETVFTSEHGTGKSLRIPGYRLAGKTGTAEKRSATTGRVGDGGYVSNFVGYVPAEKPRATILVMIDNPKGGKYYGATVAGPVFQDVAKEVIRRLDIPKSAAPLSAPTTPKSATGPEIEIRAQKTGKTPTAQPNDSQVRQGR